MKHALRYLFFLLSFVQIIFSCNEPAKNYDEPFRPQFHFSPQKNWMNDPNGLVYFDGEYHLFYQYNPLGDRWGHMSWGHAVSKDLLHWEHLPVAIPEENGIMIYSGSAVVDWQNSSGFGKGDVPPMVAVYTGRRNSDDRQTQCLAYSNDHGRTWTKYDGNPVLDIQSNNFRDPKVLWHDPTSKWIMVVSMAAERKIRFYGSHNLKEWNLLSEFGPAGAVAGIWECPDLFQLPVDGNPDSIKWVLEVDLGSKAVAGGSGGQYFVGDFDGEKFTLDPHFLEAFKDETKEPEGIVFESFENGYGSWKTEGDAFGSEPAKGAFSYQNPVNGFYGQKLINSYNGGDKATGKIISGAFKITKPYINFLIGGGNDPEKLFLSLLINGKTVLSATGDESESLNWKAWNVADFIGEEASIEVVDKHTGIWGYIMLDQILFSDAPALPRQESAAWLDYGKDFYAVASWSGIPENDGRHLWIGWMSNWQYGQDVPTSPWRSAFSVPRKVSLKKINGQIRLAQQPIEELHNLRSEKTTMQSQILSASKVIDLSGIKNPSQLEIKAEFEVADTSAEFGFELMCGEDQLTRVGFDLQRNTMYVDRTRSGKVDFHKDFPGVQTAPITLKNGQLAVHILMDKGSLEIFINDGETVMTELIFPDPQKKEQRLFVKKGSVKLKSLDVWQLKSTWN